MTDQPEPNIVTINNEEAAWNLLQQALDEDFDGDNIQLVFDNWPVIDIKINGKRHNSSLTAKNMEGLVELQKTVNRSYALLLYNSPNIANLKDSERDALELVFVVSPGSSDILAKLEDQLDIFVKAMVEKMQAKHFVICAISAGLLWAGTTCWSTWLQHQKEMKNLTYEKETRQFASEQEYKKMALIAQAAGVIPAIQSVKEESTHLYDQVLKSVATAESASIAGVEDISGKTIKALIQTEPSKSSEVRLDGDYRILKVDSSLQKAFKVQVRNIETEEIFTATLQESVVTAKRHKEYLQEAEWNWKPVRLSINAKKLRGSITGATILAVERIEGEPDQVVASTKGKSAN